MASLDIATANKNIITGGDFIKLSKAHMQMAELEEKTRDNTKEYLHNIQSIPGSSNINGINYTSRARNYLDEANNNLKSSTEKAKQSSELLRLCTSTKEAQSIEVIEKRPISKVAKIKLKLNDNFYELWTYDFYLTIKQ
ncbi:MAG: hypothetical protein PHE55_12405 [Methylococcaceae bacterium]|nr:hypothetical protein [Methylococcaceae bacterium]